MRSACDRSHFPDPPLADRAPSGQRLRLAYRAVGVALIIAIGSAPQGLHAQEVTGVPDGFFGASHFRHVGPIGNRVSAVTGVPGDADTYYVGAASGGLFKSEDGGHAWRPVFDDQPAMSIGALALAPSDPDVVWVGTGEPFIRSNVSIGNGVYRTTDGGEHWSHVGLDQSGRIGRIVVDPGNPDAAFVAALGNLYGPQEQRGVFRTRDAGATWERVLFVDENTGAVDIVMSPADPTTLFAATWQMHISPWGRESGGPGSGIWKSTDGGDSWTRLESPGLPSGTLGKIGLAMTPADPGRVYALIETNSNRDYQPLDDHEGVLWRSDDEGATWRMINADHTLAQRPLYYSRMAVAPDDPDEVHFMSTRHAKSLDGGETFESGGAGGDNHDMWIDPLLPDRMIVGHDNGISISTTRGESWYRPQLPIAQMYHVFTDTRVPYNLYGNRQDGSSFGGPSNTLSFGSIPIGAWHSVGGCESGFAIPDTVTNDRVWSGCYDGILTLHDLTTGTTRTVSVWPDNPEGWAAADVRERFQWTFPIHVSPHDHNTVYVGSQRVHRTRNGGHSWEVISPDLTTDDTSKQKASGGLTTEDVSPTYYSTLFALAESPLEEGVLWAGSNDGLVHVSRDHGESWVDVTEHIPGLPGDGTISNIEPSRYRAGAAYLTADRHQSGDSEPYVYATEDYGRHWRSLSADIPRSVFSYAHVVREDPRREGLLYLGTENSLFVSWDDGRHWHSLQEDLPHAPVHWLTLQPHFDDLVVSTYGRGFWILDDVTYLQQVTDSILSSPIHLFDPRDAYRFLIREGAAAQPGDPAAGENPDYGATLSFWLPTVSDSADATVTIEDDQGRVVRVLDISDLRGGMNRVVWDLTHTASQAPRLRTPALEHSHVVVPESGWRGQVDGGVVRPMALPGMYRVRLTAGEMERTTWLRLLQDPASRASPADMRAQLDMQLQLREMTDSATALINRIEWTRKHLRDASTGLTEGAPDLVQAGEALSQALIELEMNLFDLRLSGGSAGQDTIRWPRRLFAKLTSLAAFVSGTDDPPTDQAVEVMTGYRADLAELQRQWRALADGPLAELNRMLSQRGLQTVASIAPDPVVT